VQFEINKYQALFLRLKKGEKHALLLQKKSCKESREESCKKSCEESCKEEKINIQIPDKKSSV